MSNSIVMHLSRSGEVNIYNSDDIPHSNDLPPMMAIAAAVMNAGYTGLAIDEMKMSNGRYFHALDVDLATPEGRLLQELSHQFACGKELPNIQVVLADLQLAYKSTGNLGGAT